MENKTVSPRPQYSDEMKAEIFEGICALYESGETTIESAVKTHGINITTFYDWERANPNFQARYKKSKTILQRVYYEERVKPLARTAIETLLAGKTYTERRVKKEMLGGPDGDGELTITESVETLKEVLPNPTVAIFVTKGLEPEYFSDKPQDVNVKVESDFLANLPLEAKFQILEILKNANRSATATGDATTEHTDGDAD